MGRRAKLGVGAAAFVGAVVLDGIWAAYIQSMASGSRWAAAWAAGTILVGGSVIRLYTKDGWLLLPTAAGAALGTALVQHGF